MTGFYETKSFAAHLPETKFSYSNLEVKSDHCEGTIFTYKSFVYPPSCERNRKTLDKDMEERFAIADELNLQVQKLQELGCPVIFPTMNAHRCKIDDPVRGSEYLPGIDLNRLDDYEKMGMPTKRQLGVYEFYLFMPFDKPNLSFGQETIGMPIQPRILPNFEGQVTFLAYLMHKGYVTEQDVPTCENPVAPFSAAMFGFAKTRAKTLALET